MKYCFKIKLLLWKNWLILKNRKLVTFLEILLPTIFATILVLIRTNVSSKLINQPISWEPYDVVIDCDSYFENVLCEHRWNLFFSPNTSLTEDIIKILLKKWKYFDEAKGFANEDLMVTDLMNLNQDNSHVLAGIVFEKINFDKINDFELTYKLRFPYNLRSGTNPFNFDIKKIDNKWFTQLKFPFFQTVGPRSLKFNFGGPPDYASEGFLMLQHLVDRSITSYFTNESYKIDEYFDINMQRMSYPPYIDDKFVMVIQQQLPLIIMISFVYCSMQVVKDVVEEKEKKLKESMKLMGLYNNLHWISWFIKYLILISCSVLIELILFCSHLSVNGKVITQSNPLIIFIFLIVYGVSIIAFSFFVSTLFSIASTAAAAAGAIFFISYIPYFIIQPRYLDIDLFVKIITSFIPNVAMAYGCQIIGMFEGIGSGVQFSNLFRPVSIDDSLSLFVVIVMLLIDSILYTLFALYIEAVYPGDYGIPSHFLFPFMWCKNERDCNIATDETEIQSKLNIQEETVTNLLPGIEISNLTKIYTKNGMSITGIKDLNMTCYNGEITSLLGHNGAGKTTTMSILSGFITASSGSVLIHGLDLKRNIDEIRMKLGFCPQHNILFDNMTVQQHMTFFSLLRQNNNSELSINDDEMLHNVGLFDKKYSLVGSLSGGMKRMLSIALALVGSPNIIILDEPTSGMDVEHRRQAWDLLRKYKNGRTILISTHYLDEADMLSDRIIILNTGSLMCAGSPLYLKNKYGNGYKLTIVMSKTCKLDMLKAFMKKYILNCSIERIFGCEIVFNLPYSARQEFKVLFQQLDLNLSNLNIYNYGISTATINHIFLSLDISNSSQPSNEQSEIGANEINNLMNESTPLLLPKSGSRLPPNKCYLLFKQILMMLYKRFLYMIRNLLFSIFLIFIPIFFTLMSLIVLKTLPNILDPPPLILNLFKYGQSNVVYSYGIKPDNHTIQLAYYFAIQFKNNHDISLINVQEDQTYRNMSFAVDKYLVERGVRDLSEFTGHYLIALDFMFPNKSSVDDYLSMNNNSKIRTHYAHNSDRIYNGIHTYNSSIHTYDNMVENTYFHVNTDINIDANSKVNNSYSTIYKKSIIPVIYFNNQAYHASAIALNAFNVGAMKYAFVEANKLQLNNSLRINVINHPLPKTLNDSLTDQIFEDMQGFAIAFNSVFGISFLSASVAIYIVKERVSGARHQQIISGISYFSYWLPNLIFDFTVLLIGIFGMLILFPIFDIQCYASNAGVLLLLFITYSWATIPFIYLLSLAFNLASSAFIALSFFNIISGLVCLISVDILSIPQLDLLNVSDILQNIFLILFPSFCLGKGLDNISQNYNALKICLMPEIEMLCKINPNFPCCKDTCTVNCIPFDENYLSMSKISIGRMLISMSLHGLLFFFIIFLIDVKAFDKLKQLFWSRRMYYEDQLYGGNLDSDVEEERRIALASQSDQLEPLLVKNITKFYGKHFKAIHDISFRVSLEECFGLLGVNGAGKTTFFKMLTGEIPIEFGEATIFGVDIMNNMIGVYKNIGYCGQFDSLLDHMTGYEQLYMHATIRGISNRKKHVQQVIENLSLQAHANKIVATYSGGTKRKLSTAIAIIGDRQLILLDEPTAGMDIQSRQHLHNFLTNSIKNRSIILTSHNLEECEAVCTRIGIMVNGKFQCIGSPQHLRNTFGSGYIVTVKIKNFNNRSTIFDLLKTSLTSAAEKDNEASATSNEGGNIIQDIVPIDQIYNVDENYSNQMLKVFVAKWVKLWQIFSVLESIFEDDLILDYGVSQSSLEDVFMKMAAHQITIDVV